MPIRRGGYGLPHDFRIPGPLAGNPSRGLLAIEATERLACRATVPFFRHMFQRQDAVEHDDGGEGRLRR